MCKILYRLLREKIRDIVILKRKREDLINDEFSIISADCTGGMVYHELHKEFISPTINMFMKASDFVRFCSDISYWIDQVMIEVETEYRYPVAMLGENGPVLHLVHYDSVEQAQIKWNERKHKINYNNLFFIMNDRNDCTTEIAKQFDELPYKNKVFFSCKPVSGIKCGYFIKGFEDRDHVPVMTEFCNKFSIRRNIDQFDFINWFNSGEKGELNKSG